MRTGPAASSGGRGGHDRGLGGAVGVPDLATRDRHVLHERRRTGLAPEDEEAHLVEGIVGPEGGEGGDGGHDGDPLRGQPRTEIHAGPDQGAGRWDQAGPVTPRQPHLLARRIERDRQPREHAVIGPDRLIDDEGSASASTNVARRSMGDGDPLGTPGGARGEDDPGVVVDLHQGPWSVSGGSRW